MRMDVRRTSLPEVLVVEHEVFEDERGFFMEVYRADLFAEFTPTWACPASSCS